MDFDSLVDDSHKSSATAKGMRFDDLQDDSEKYGDTAGALKAFGLGAARSASFGLSDEFLVRSGAMKPDDIKGYREANPIASPAGEVAGVLGAVLAPEVGAAGLLSAPVKAVARAGTAVAEAAAIPAATAAGKVLSQAGAMAAGSAVEGLAYGAGQTVTEHALGDPDLNAEKVLSNIGTAALVGGGLGAVFGAAKGALQAKFPRFIPDADRAAIESGDFAKTIEHSELPKPEKEGILKGLTKKKADASEIEAYAAEKGLPLNPAQLSKSETVEHVYDVLLHEPLTMAGGKQRALATQGFEGAIADVDNTIGAGAKMSKAELGEALQTGMAQKFEAQYQPIKDLYGALEPYQEAIPITEKSTASLSRTIRDVIKAENLIAGTPEHNFVETMANGIEQVDSIAKLKSFRTALNRATGKETRFVSEIIKDKLDGVEQRAIKRFADTMKTDKAKEKILSLIDQSEQAKSAYAGLREEMQTIAGKRRIYGPQDFLNYIKEDLTPEQFVRKVWDRGNSKLQKYIAQNYPEQFELIKQYRIAELKESAMKGGNPKKIFKEIEKLTKEERDLLFTAEQQGAISRAEKYINSFPRNFNPSGTEHTRALRDFFEGPKSVIGANIRASAMEKFINNVGKFEPEAEAIISGLAELERAAQKTTKSIQSGASAIFSTKDYGSPVKGYLAISSEDKRKDHDKLHARLSEYQASPERLMDKMAEDVAALSEFAPNTAGSVQAAGARAVAFLHSKLPGADVPTKPLEPSYQPSNAEVAKWYRYFNAVQSPTDALVEVANGTLTPETMETLYSVYPKLLKEMQGVLTDKMVDAVAKKKPVPFRSKMTLSMFLGSDLVSALEPSRILANQNMLATATQAKAGLEMAQMTGVNKKGFDKIDSAENAMTPMQKSAARKEA